MKHLPIVLGNAITQFLTDSDNLQFIISHKDANLIVTNAPRQTEFTININSKDLYKKYRNIKLELSSLNENNFIKNSRDIMAKFNTIPVIFLEKITIDAIKRKNADISIVFEKLCISYELIILFDRINVCTNVRTLDVFDYSMFRAFHKFPNLTSLTSSGSDGTYYEHISIPKLECLYTERITNGKYYVMMGNIPKNWTSIVALQTSLLVPETFINLKVLFTRTDPNKIVPDNIAKLIEYLYIGNNEVENIDITRFTNLKQLHICDSIEVIHGMNPEIKLIVD